jgi:DNA gyrase subunit A
LTDIEDPPPPPPAYPQGVQPISIEEEMRTSYLDYAMSVIVSRALPDVRDGLKPVHRRVLWSMHESGYTHDKSYRKSARIVGDVMGKYHPHGDQSIYDTMVRMAQSFSLRLPLLDGQGNFGSMDGDRAAAMRYTEIRMAESAEALLENIDKSTVDFQDNYDGSESEPTVLPSRVPNLLVNGAGGIAVGMATNIPPHNLGEVIDACCAYVDNPGVTTEELIEYVPAPDFPTGGLILGSGGARQAYHTGKGSVIMRSKTHIEELSRDREAIIVTEVPYQVNKSRMVEQIADLTRDKRIEGIGDLRDESDRDGVRVVIELKRDVNTDVVLNQLYRHTQLQTSFGMNMLALNGGRPMIHTLREFVSAFVDFREQVITRRTIHDLGKARDRAEVLVGLAIAVANIDEVIALIRNAPDPATARGLLMERSWPASEVEGLINLIDDPGHGLVDGVYRLNMTQARAILDLRLQRLTALGRDEVADELTELAEKIKDLLDILDDRVRLMGILRDELVEIKEKFSNPRRTEILEGAFGGVEDEDLIQREDMVVTVSHGGYIKRVPLSAYRAQRRGGRGRSGMSTKDEDFVANVFVANTHTPMLFFSSIGQVYKLKVYKLPQGTPQSRGKAMVNMLPLSTDETITTIMPLPEDETTWDELHIMFATSNGKVRRNSLDDFSQVKANGKIAIRLDDDDALVGVATCSEEDDVLLAAHGGKCIRFPVTAVRVFKSRTSDGVRGINLGKDDKVLSMSIVRHEKIDVEERDAYLRWSNANRRGEDVTDTGLTSERLAEIAEREEFILSVTENGFGKRTSAYEYRIAGRGGQGIINIETSDRNGGVVAAFTVADDDEIMLVTNAGQLIRCPVHDIRIAGRNTQGVTLFKTSADEQVVSVAHLEGTEDDDEGEDDGTEEANGSDEAPEAEVISDGDAD